jgi:hypothetical protein
MGGKSRRRAMVDREELDDVAQADEPSVASPSIGNRATVALLEAGTTAARSSDADRPAAVTSALAPRAIRRAPEAVQRRIDVNVGADTNLGMAVVGFHQIEQDDLSPEEFAGLKNDHQRFMPLFGRFATAHNVDLIIDSGNKNVTGDMAITQLFGFTQDGKAINETKGQVFHEAVKAKEFTRFEVRVLFWASRVKVPPDDVYLLTSAPAILQAFTHEMTVHAENMLDFVEAYWAYTQGKGGLPKALPDASSEHQAFTKGVVARYEFMKQRVAKGSDANRAKGFSSRELSDRMTAK